MNRAHFIRMSRVLGVIVSSLALFFIWTSISFAQFSLGNDELRITSSPLFPEPNQMVRLSIDTFAVDVVGADIYWYVDGVLQEQLQNSLEVEITAEGLGSQTPVEVRVVKNGITTQIINHTIQPIEIDIIVEADTYIPQLYKGRALAGSESNIRLIAFVHTGSGINASELSYRWSIDRGVLFGGALKGRNVVETTMPIFEGSYVMVEVTDRNGNLIGQKTVPLTRHQPELYFYEYSPLRGLAQKAIDEDLIVISDPTTIYAEPYFMNMKNNAIDAIFEWEVGNEKIETPQIPNVISVRDPGDKDFAKLSASVRSGLAQYLKESIMLRFNQ